MFAYINLSGPYNYCSDLEPGNVTRVQSSILCGVLNTETELQGELGLPCPALS